MIMTICLFVASCKLLNYVYVGGDDWAHILWHSYDCAQQIDNLFIGSSHVYCNVNPFLLDIINGQDNFNLGVGNLSVRGSYYALREAVGDHPEIDNVYLELYYGINAGRDDSERIKGDWRLTSYMKPSVNKYQLLFSASGSEHYLESLFSFVRYRSKLFDLNYIKNEIKHKRSEDWRNYRFQYEFDDGNGMVEYWDKGFYDTTSVYREESLLYHTELNLENEGLLDENNIRYLEKIIEYCQEKGITIQLFVSPIYETQILSAENYDAYHQQILTIAEAYHVPFYDFNLCKFEYLDLGRELYHDIGHLNTAGADTFTPFLWEVLTNKEEENRMYFCDSFLDRICSEPPELYGVYYDIDADDRKECTVASNRDNDELVYRIIITPDEGEQYVVQDFSDNKTFVLPDDGTGWLTVVARDRAGNVQTLEMVY